MTKLFYIARTSKPGSVIHVNIIMEKMVNLQRKKQTSGLSADAKYGFQHRYSVTKGNIFHESERSV